MGNKNFRPEKTNVEKLKIEEAIEEVIEETKEDISESAVEEEVVEETKEDISESAVEEEVVETLYGIIKDCSKLNIRKKPNTSADVVCIVNEGTEVKINTDGVDGWYGVCTANGIEGYCMSKFVELK